MLFPTTLLITWLIGLLALALLGVSLYFLYRAIRRWNRPQPVVVEDRSNRRLAVRRESADARAILSVPPFQDPAVMIPLILGISLLLLSFAGRHVIQYAFPAGQDEPQAMRTGTVQYVNQSDGSKIRVEMYGQPDAPTLVFTHGWGTNSTEWYYAKRQLSTQFRLVLWDLPGLGESAQPADRDFSLEKMASDLHSVLSVTNGKPVVLVGHSIGGMINLTFCRLFPELLGHQVAGIAQVDTTYTNPVRTTKNSSFNLAIQKPVGEPLLYAMIGLSPLVRVMNWLSYENGSAYLLNAQSSFAGSETRGELDLVSRYQYESSPAVVARGTLAMFHWDAAPVLPQITVPVLILVGQQDTTTLPSASEHMRATMPKAELRMVDPSAHYGLLEQNQRFNSEIARFALQYLK